MKEGRKVVATVLAMSMMISVEGCSKQFDESMVSIAGKVCGSIADGDYAKASKYFDDKNKKLEEAMTFESDDDTSNAAAELILDTITYEVDEDSYESDFFGKTGSIDVVFSYVDYEKVLDSQDLFKDFQAFSDALEECDDTIEFSVTLEFEKQDGNAVIVNSDDFIDLFKFSDIEIELAGLLGDYVSTQYFTGSEYSSSDNTYTDTDELSYVVELTGAGTDFEWDYYYTITSISGYSFTSEVITKPEGESTISIVTSEPISGDFIADGTFHVDIYDADDNYVAGGYCDVTHYEPEPEPEPVSGTGFYPYYVDSTTSPVTLYGGDVIFTCPSSSWTIQPVESSYVSGSSNADSYISSFTTMVVTGDSALVTVLYLTPTIYDSFASDEQMLIEAMAAGALDDGETVEFTTVDREICGQTITCYEATITGNGSELHMCLFVLTVDDSSFFVTVGGDYASIEACCSAFSVA